MDIGSTNSNSCQYTFYFKKSLFPVQLVVWFKNFGELGMVQAFRSKWNISVWGVVWRKSSNCKSSRTFQTIKEGGIPPKNGLSISHQRGIFREIASKVPTSGGGGIYVSSQIKESKSWRRTCIYIYIYIYISSGQIIIFHQPGFSWNKGSHFPSLATFWVPRSCEVAIVWPDIVQGTNISHLAKRKIIFKSAFKTGDMLVFKGTFITKILVPPFKSLLVGGFNPFEKNDRQNGFIFPKDWGKNYKKNSWSCHHLLGGSSHDL